MTEEKNINEKGPSVRISIPADNPAQVQNRSKNDPEASLLETIAQKVSDLVEGNKEKILNVLKKQSFSLNGIFAKSDNSKDSLYFGTEIKGNELTDNPESQKKTIQVKIFITRELLFSRLGPLHEIESMFNKPVDSQKMLQILEETRAVDKNIQEIKVI